LSHKQVSLLIIVVFLGISFLVGCGGSAPATESETAAATSTPEQATPTATATPEQVTPTPTMVRLPRKQVERPAITITLPEGDPERGFSLEGKYRCARCHIKSERSPRFWANGELPAILARAEMRIADPAYSGSATTPEEYLIESITDPRLYEVDGDWEQSMYDDYYDLPEQDLADIIAWMLTVEE
jgi:hypothetical protein